MLSKFATRFSIILVSVLVLIAMAIHFAFTGGRHSVELWIVLFPVILAIPILSAVFIASDSELGV